MEILHNHTHTPEQSTILTNRYTRIHQWLAQIVQQLLPRKNESTHLFYNKNNVHDMIHYFMTGKYRSKKRYI